MKFKVGDEVKSCKYIGKVIACCTYLHMDHSDFYLIISNDKFNHLSCMITVEQLISNFHCKIISSVEPSIKVDMYKIIQYAADADLELCIAKILHCRVCNIEYPYAVPNQADGSLICYSCRNMP